MAHDAPRRWFASIGHRDESSKKKAIVLSIIAIDHVLRWRPLTQERNGDSWPKERTDWSVCPEAGLAHRVATSGSPGELGWDAMREALWKLLFSSWKLLFSSLADLILGRGRSFPSSAVVCDEQVYAVGLGWVSGGEVGGVEMTLLAHSPR